MACLPRLCSSFCLPLLFRGWEARATSDSDCLFPSSVLLLFTSKMKCSDENAVCQMFLTLGEWRKRTEAAFDWNESRSACEQYTSARQSPGILGFSHTWVTSRQPLLSEVCLRYSSRWQNLMCITIKFNEFGALFQVFLILRSFRIIILSPTDQVYFPAQRQVVTHQSHSYPFVLKENVRGFVTRFAEIRKDSSASEPCFPSAMHHEQPNLTAVCGGGGGSHWLGVNFFMIS